MSWQEQGRQTHGWFGHGTAPAKLQNAPSDTSSTEKSKGDSVLALAYGALAALPAAQRARAEAQFQGTNLSGFRQAMEAWMRGNRMDQATFADRFFGRSADDPIAQTLRNAADLANAATTPTDMAQAAGKLAEAMKKVGLDRWCRFVADAQARARDSATEAAIKESLKPTDPRRDAIRPVYPLETALGLAAAGTRGAAALLRAAGGAAFRQLVPESRPATRGPAAGNAEKPGSAPASDAAPAPSAGRTDPISRQRQDGHISGMPQNRNRLRQGTPTSTFDGDARTADALTREAWARESRSQVERVSANTTSVGELVSGREAAGNPRSACIRTQQVEFTAILQDRSHHEPKWTKPSGERHDERNFLGAERLLWRSRKP